MKKTLAVLIMISLLFSFFACARKEELFDAKKDTPRGFIHARGQDLMLDGKRVILKGVNAGGWLLTEDWFTPTSLDADLTSEHGQYELEAALTERHGSAKTQKLMEIYRKNWWKEADFENIASIGFNMIRLPFGWQDITDESGNVKENAFTNLDWFAAQCEAHQLFLILDLHGAYGSQNGRHHSGDTATGGNLFGNPENEQLTIELWKTVAAHFKDNVWVAGYDLLNEPEGQPGGLTEKTQWDYYKKLHDAVRSVDDKHLLFLESCWDADHLPNPTEYGFKNVAYEYHYYNWDNSNDLHSMKSFFRYKAKMERKYNRHGFHVPVFIGEFTFFDNPDCWRYGLDFFEKHGMSWAMWTYKGCVQSNWVLYQGEKRTAETVVTPETPYRSATAIFKRIGTEEAFEANESLIELIKEYL